MQKLTIFAMVRAFRRHWSNDAKNNMFIAFKTAISVATNFSTAVKPIESKFYCLSAYQNMEKAAMNIQYKGVTQQCLIIIPELSTYEFFRMLARLLYSRIGNFL